MTALDTKALLPCPFCGNDGFWPIEDALQIHHNEPDYVHDFSHTWSVQCDKCTATMGYSDSEEEAIAAWNRRVSPSQGEGPAADVVEAETVWIVGASVGEYSDRSDWTVGVWIREQDAQAFIRNIDALAMHSDSIAQTKPSPIKRPKLAAARSTLPGPVMAAMRRSIRAGKKRCTVPPPSLH